MLIIYRPLSKTIADDSKLLGFLADYCFDKKWILLGVLTSPLRWLPENYGLPTPHAQEIMDPFDELNLTQWVCEPTYTSGSNLDLIFNSDDTAIIDCWTLAHFLNCQHSITICSYLCKIPEENISSFKTLDLLSGGLWPCQETYAFNSLGF